MGGSFIPKVDQFPGVYGRTISSTLEFQNSGCASNVLIVQNSQLKCEIFQGIFNATRTNAKASFMGIIM